MYNILEHIVIMALSVRIKIRMITVFLVRKNLGGQTLVLKAI